MKYISRSQWYVALVEDFLETPDALRMPIQLYASEARRIEKKYPNVTIFVGPVLSVTDQRHSCVIQKDVMVH